MSTLLISKSNLAEAPSQSTELTRRVMDQLASGSYAVLRNVECLEQKGRIVLRGSVPSFFLKQMAQSLVAKVPGVLGVDNQLDVVDPRK